MVLAVKNTTDAGDDAAADTEDNSAAKAEYDAAADGDTQYIEQVKKTLTPEIGLMFANQGFSRMCDYVPFSELKLFRLVCHTWNDVITIHRRFHDAHLKIGIGWESNYSNFQLNVINKWKTVTLNCFALHLCQNNLFTKYWTEAAKCVKVLNLEFIRVSCQDLGNVINDCSFLESISFVKIHFSKITFRPAQGNQPEDNRRRNSNNIDTPRICICCQHNFFIPSGKGAVGPSTIKFISISKQLAFPLCILDLLFHRSQGKLETFKFESTNQNIQTQGDTRPNIVQMQNYLLRISQGSNQTLKNFIWIKGGDNGHIIQLLTHEHFHPGLDKLSISEKYDEEHYKTHRYSDTLRVPIINFLQKQLGLIEINISLVNFTHRFIEEIKNILRTMPLLQKIKFHIDKLTQQLDINIFQHAISLNELEIITRTKSDEYDGNNNNNPSQILTSNYLENLPLTIRKLVCNHELNQSILATSLMHPSFILLSKLKIIKGNVVNDHIAQLIIVHLTQLQELAIHNSFYLTDSGLTGLDPNGCSRMMYFHSQTLLLNKSKETNGAKRVLNELIYLRELDLTGCRNLSDISVCYAIRFPQLKKLTLSGCCDVSDIGLISLGTHNPRLETLILTRNRRISHYGLNRLIQNCKTLRSVKTTKNVANRLSTSGIIYYTPSIHFKDIVSFTPTRLPTKKD